MARFRDTALPPESKSSAGTAAAPDAATGAKSGPELRDRSIGDIISRMRNLSAEHIESILSYQQQHHVRFGEAAVALGYVSTDDVLYALSQQFHYSYAPRESRASSPELVTMNQPFSLQSESFRATRSQVMMRIYGEGEPPALAVISPDIGDGKTYFAANLAVVLAQLGGRTLLVDADLRSPRQHAVFNVPNDVGLSTILSGRAERQVIKQGAGLPSLYVLPAGVTPPNPLELVERPAFGLLMKQLVAKFDHVIVDTPAAAHGADASVIAARCGAALLVARKDESRVNRLADLVDSLTGAPVRLAGVIVNEY
jgi:chain length determinant protein tyrosine kinase EpsG